MRVNNLTKWHVITASIAGVMVGSTVGLWAGINLRLEEPVRISGPDYAVYPQIVRLPKVEKH